MEIQVMGRSFKIKRMPTIISWSVDGQHKSIRYDTKPISYGCALALCNIRRRGLTGLHLKTIIKIDKQLN